MLAKKGIDIGDDVDGIPDSMRQLLAMQAMESGRPFPRALMGRPGGPMQYGNGMLMNGDPNGSGKVGKCNNASAPTGTFANEHPVIHHFTCRSLSIGTWRRVGQNAMDLVIFYSPDKACLTYYINNDSAGYKIEFPFAFIKSIQLEAGDGPNVTGSPSRPGGLVIELTRPPHFFMDSSGSGGFYQCGDFTEDQQASQILTHHLGGHPKVLSGQLAKLVSLESFQNRMNPFDAHAMSASAPTSPTMGIVRPASQPHFTRPNPPHVGMYQENHFGISPHLHPGRMHGGHKRQRSRSVPIAIDFSMLHGGQMPTFNFQQPSPQLPPEGHGHFQPPMHHQSPMHGPIGPSLQIDTSAGYGMDFRHMPPHSATATSPSEFASPGFFPSNPGHVGQHDFGTPQYNMPFLSPSPMVEQGPMQPPVSHSPTPQMVHHDPVIANNSPPLHTMQRSASADMFSMGHHDPSMHDETLMLGEMYSKQNLNMPMPSPGFDDNGIMLHDMSEYHTPRDEMQMPMTPYGTIDPNHLQGGLHP